MNEYIRSQSMAAGPVLLKDLKCGTCKYKDESIPTIYCKVFKKGEERKPNAVLLGKDCAFYEEE